MKEHLLNKTRDVAGYMNIRKSVRKKCLHMAKLYCTNRGYISIVVRDYSSFGLCVRSDYDAFIGEKLTLKFPNGEFRHGIVRWVQLAKIGMEMEMPVSPLDFVSTKLGYGLMMADT